MARMPSVVLCSIGSGPHRELLDIARPGFEEWAARQGYDLDLRAQAPTHGRPPAWAKIPLLRERLGTHEVALWVDADAVVVDASGDLAATVSGCRPIALVAHRYAGQTVPNTGVLALRSGPTSKLFLDTLWEMTQYIDHKWWENAAALDLLGYDVAAEPIQNVPNSRWEKRVQWLGNEWNSIDLDPAQRPLIRHFPGMSQGARRERMTKACARSRLDPAVYVA
jgi:hypothetical protein